MSEALIAAGAEAPRFALPDLNGRMVDPLAPGSGDAAPVLLVFFKDDCPTCRFTLPFIERMRRLLEREYAGVPIYGISQDSPARTRAFMQETGAAFPVLVEGEGYPVSTEYGLEAVPTVVLVGGDRKVLRSQPGFHRTTYASIARELAGGKAAVLPPLFGADESVPEARPG